MRMNTKTKKSFIRRIGLMKRIPPKLKRFVLDYNERWLAGAVPDGIRRLILEMGMDLEWGEIMGIIEEDMRNGITYPDIDHGLIISIMSHGK